MKTLYFNGNIITLENDNPEAILCDELIIEVGTFDSLKQMMDEDDVMFDLNHQTMLPGFIDCHSNILSYAMTLNLVDLRGSHSIDELKVKLKRQIGFKKYLYGFGYDHNLLIEGRHPTKDDLNEVSKTIPIVIIHSSGHMGVFNDMAMKEYDVDYFKTTFEGGRVGLENGYLNGFFEDNAFFYYAKNLETPLFDEILTNLEEAYKVYASYGITTLQEGFVRNKEWEILKQASLRKRFPIDTICYVDIKDNRNVLIKNKDYQGYNNGLKIGGYKLYLDGSLQEKTAWMKENYINSDSCGYPIYEFEEGYEYFKQAVEDQKQLLVHANGSAACKQMINLCNQSSNIEYRPVMIHAQMLDKEDMKEVYVNGIIPSFSISHIYYYGDINLENIGTKAKDISPAKTALENDVIFTFHQDTPNLMPNILELIDCSVNRLTKSKYPFNDEKISPYEALKAVTINGSYQYFEEEMKGTIKKNKFSDFVILSDNPLTIDPSKIKDIKVMYTIKRNEIIYENK